MKVHLTIFLAVLIASVSSFNFSYVLPDTDPWYVPDFINGTFIWITKAFVKGELALLSVEPDMVDYYLYTNSNPTKSQKLDYDDPDTLKRSSFDPSVSTRIIVHGYKSSSESPLCSLIRDSELKKYKRNIICVDWSKIADATYPTARFVMPSVARDLAKFINFLLKYTSMNYKNLHLIGHSLGAHAAGLAAKELQKENKQITLIVGCDPALPLFSYDDCSNRLCKNDAEYVQSIQTNGGKLGFLQPIGGLAFYPNGGVSQPGCGTDLIGSCSHSRSYMYLAEAILKNDFPTMKCLTQFGYINAVMKHCGRKYSSVRMGSPESIGVEGIYYVPVNSQPPYGKG